MQSRPRGSEWPWLPAAGATHAAHRSSSAGVTVDCASTQPRSPPPCSVCPCTADYLDPVDFIARTLRCIAGSRTYVMRPSHESSIMRTHAKSSEMLCDTRWTSLMSAGSDYSRQKPCPGWPHMGRSLIPDTSMAGSFWRTAGDLQRHQALLITAVSSLQMIVYCLAVTHQAHRSCRQEPMMPWDNL